MSCPSQLLSSIETLGIEELSLAGAFSFASVRKATCTSIVINTSASLVHKCAERPGAVVVYLTRWTLTRPWCAGEITSAHACNVPVFAVVTSSFVKPTPAELDSLSDYVDFTSFKPALVCKLRCLFQLLGGVAHTLTRCSPTLVRCMLGH